MTDPMTGYEQAESEAVERQDEARREQHWREAEQAAHSMIEAFTELGGTNASAVRFVIEHACIKSHTSCHYGDCRTVRAFAAAYGISDLLRVIATALEAK